MYWGKDYVGGFDTAARAKHADCIKVLEVMVWTRLAIFMMAGLGCVCCCLCCLLVCCGCCVAGGMISSRMPESIQKMAEERKKKKEAAAAGGETELQE